MQLKPNVPVKIAVAEDEPDIRKTFVWLLERLGHEVVCAAENGEELLDKCQLGTVDLVFVDLDMPVMDGLAAAEHIKKRGIPVILVSGHADAEHVVLEHEPIVTRLRKPITLEALQESISLALRIE
ncbi:MAG TPA: response regulator [Lacipirellulaceae bacterium]|nr:response regulator [Lacipirellulaceae bacterium]